MAHVVVIVPHELVPGFRLAGTRATAADSDADAATLVDAYLDDPDVGVLGVYEPFLDALGAERRRALERLPRPVVVPILTGAPRASSDDRRAHLLALLEDAVGLRLTFRGVEEGPMTPANRAEGRLARIAGPVVSAEGLLHTRLYDVVEVGDAGLLGEVIRLERDEATIQVYEDTTGLRPGEPVVDTGRPLEVELGPGLLGQIFDGVQRPLGPILEETGTPFLRRGVRARALSRERRWDFTPAVDDGDTVDQGDLLGTVQEGPLLHRVLVPVGMRGQVRDVVGGERTVDEPIAVIDDEPVTLAARWPVREARPFADRLPPAGPLVTGQRVLDTFAPLARGSSAAIPGGFGTGKTVLEQSLARWLDADVIIYIGCGERGNELTEVLEEFPKLEDPRTGTSLMDRMILIANTSNMPVAAREASIYTGIAMAEYFRDQGYDVAVTADSTSRWGEALREVSARLEEMPGDEGYPAHLASRIAGVYERSGAVVALDGERRGSLTLIGAVSPPGGDFTEPLTQYTLRIVDTFWALDTALARRRHFPAVDTARSYSLHPLDAWFSEQVHADWAHQRAWATEMLQQADELAGVVKLLGEEVLAAGEKLTLRTARMIREDFLQQSALDPTDAFCPLEKQFWMLWALRGVHAALAETGAVIEPSLALDVARMREWPAGEEEARARDLVARAGEAG